MMLLGNRDLMLALLNAAPKMAQVPRRLCIDSTPAEVCKQFDVYFNGVKQRLCHTADVDQGYIIRFKLGIGNMPVRNRFGKYDTEQLQGKVQIVRKGEQPSVASEQRDPSPDRPAD